MGSKNSSLFVTIAAGCVLLAGCNKAADSSEAGGAASADSSVSPTNAASSSAVPQNAVSPSVPAQDADHLPGISASAASNIAFAYRYAFALPGKSISDVQQRHVTACEALGPDKCEVTGFTLHQSGEDDATGEVDFKIDRNLAQKFGGNAIDAVKKADGQLTTASVDGADNNDAISDVQANNASAQAQLNKVEQRLAEGDLSQDQRSNLRSQGNQLRQILTANDSHAQNIRKAIAKTPVVFTYESASALAGGNNPFGKAAGASWSGVTAILSLFLMFLGITLPWLLLLGVPTAAIWLWLRSRRKLQALTATLENTNPAQ